MRKNKKYYNFTEKQKRKDRKFNGYHFHTVGKFWKRRASKYFRKTDKSTLKRMLAEDIELPLLRYRKYMWWDM